MIDTHLDADDKKKKNLRANNPFVWQSLFDELTSSPLCTRAVPFSKQLPLNDTQMAKEFIATPLCLVSPSELLFHAPYDPTHLL